MFKNSEFSGHYAIDYQYDLSIQENTNPLMEMECTLEDPFYSSFYSLTPGDDHVLYYSIIIFYKKNID